jgi:putative hydrolase of the HAD superfamily
LKAIVFDLDDTLYAERDYVLSGFRALERWAERQLRIRPGEAYTELARLFDAGARVDTFNRWLAARGLDGELVHEMVDVYRAHSPDIWPRPGVEQLLMRLGSRYRLGLVSDGELPVQRAKLRRLGLGRYLDEVLFTAECGAGYSKPSPVPFETLLRRLGADGRNAVYVADNPIKDFVGARRSGMHTMRLRMADGIYGHLDPTGPPFAADEEIGRLEELEGCIAALEEAVPT